MHTFVAICTAPFRCEGKYIVKAPNAIKAGDKVGDYLRKTYDIKDGEVCMYSVAYATEIA